MTLGGSMEARREAQAAERNARISPWSGRFRARGRDRTGEGAAMRIGPRMPSLRKRVAARTSWSATSGTLSA